MRMSANWCHGSAQGTSSTLSRRRSPATPPFQPAFRAEFEMAFSPAFSASRDVDDVSFFCLLSLQPELWGILTAGYLPLIPHQEEMSLNSGVSHHNTPTESEILSALRIKSFRLAFVVSPKGELLWTWSNV